MVLFSEAFFAVALLGLSPLEAFLLRTMIDVQLAVLSTEITESIGCAAEFIARPQEVANTRLRYLHSYCFKSHVLKGDSTTLIVYKDSSFVRHGMFVSRFLPSSLPEGNLHIRGRNSETLLHMMQRQVGKGGHGEDRLNISGSK